MKEKEKEQLRQKLLSKSVIFRERKKTVHILPILHVNSDLVRKVRICVTPPPPLVRKNQKLSNLPYPPFKKKSEKS